MSREISQDLSTLDYIILGLLGRSPESAAGVRGTLTLGVMRWRASSDTTAKKLRQLQRKRLVTTKRQPTDKKQRDKLYRLTAQGEVVLDQWLRDMRGSGSEPVDIHDIMLVKFVLAETRLTQEEILLWLDTYEKSLVERLTKFRVYYQLAMYLDSFHQKLVYESLLMTYVEQRRWIGIARHALLNKPVGGDPSFLFHESEASYLDSMSS